MTWFTLDRHDILDKPESTVGLDEQQRMELVNQLSKQLRTQNSQLDEYDLYYRGKQPLFFLHPEVELAVGDRLKNLLLNLPRLALDSVDERLDVEGFRIAGSEVMDSAAWSFWQGSDFDLASGRTHLRAMRHGEAFVSVWDRNGQPRLAAESAKSLTASYEPGSTVIRSALKGWKDGGGAVEYATLYLPDWIVKYHRGRDVPVTEGRAGDWQLRAAPIENPLGIVPIVPFVNRYDEDMPHGESEMTDVMHVADAINKLATDMMVSSEFHAMPRRWATGMEIPKGPEGRRLEQEAKRYWDQATAGRTWLGGKDVKFGQFDAAGLDNFVNSITMLLQIYAALAGIPPHYIGITHDNPASADAIRSSEARLVKKVSRKMRSFGESWEDVINLAFLVRDQKLPDGIEGLETVWRSPETPTIAQKADAAVKLKAEGIITDEQAQEDLGYTPAQRDRMRQQKLDAVALQATADMRARVAQALDLMSTYGVSERTAFAAVGLVQPVKGGASGPEAPPPPDGDPLDTSGDAAKGGTVAA